MQTLKEYLCEGLRAVRNFPTETDFYDDAKGLVFRRNLLPTGKERFTVFQVFPDAEGGNRVLGDFLKYETLADAQEAVRLKKLQKL